MRPCLPSMAMHWRALLRLARRWKAARACRLVCWVLPSCWLSSFVLHFFFFRPRTKAACWGFGAWILRGRWPHPWITRRQMQGWWHCGGRRALLSVFGSGAAAAATRRLLLVCRGGGSLSQEASRRHVRTCPLLLAFPLPPQRRRPGKTFTRPHTHFGGGALARRLSGPAGSHCHAARTCAHTPPPYLPLIHHHAHPQQAAWTTDAHARAAATTTATDDDDAPLPGRRSPIG